MMHFDKGRLDWMQTISPAMAEFCEAAAGENAAPSECSKLFLDATAYHTATLSKIARGGGFAAHLNALSQLLEPGETMPSLFEGEVWNSMGVTSPKKLKTDNAEGMLSQEAGFFMPDPESFFVHYEIGREGCEFFVQGPQGGTSRFVDILANAAVRVKKLLGEV